jgi:hypothetical protein
VTQLSMPPLSWLTLERYVLDELAPGERARVEQQLAQSSADRACLDEILNDLSVLPPLPAPAPAKVTSIDSARRRRRSLAMVGSALAVAAALALVVLRPSDLPAARRPVRDGAKGGEVALALVGEQQGELPARFFAGERFKLLVTCPSWLGRQLHVVVFQDGRRYEPLVQLDDFACGNRVPWPGAFALDGDTPAAVCVTWHEQRELLQTASRPSQLEPSVVCERLRPGSANNQ